MQRYNQTALGRIATAEEVADAALFLASDLSSGITGQAITVDAGANSDGPGERRAPPCSI